VSDPRDPNSPGLHWLPKHARLVRWDRSFMVGDTPFRWHSRLDGTAVIHGPAGHFALEDTLPMPVGHMHGATPVEPVMYVITQLHVDEHGLAWMEARRKDPPR
jgi:hypothetical protein